MAGIDRRSAWWLKHPLPVFLPLQAALLFYNLSLLPIWGDEQFTLDAISAPWSAIPGLLRADIHPPLYYFLIKAWTLLPWPGSLIEQARAFSVVWCLLSTVLVYELWVKQWQEKQRLWFLVLWTLSPALVLYSRMGRSYTLQLFCGCLLLFAALRFVADPLRTRSMLQYSAAAVLTLYVHYLPGIALVSATTLEYALLRRTNPARHPWKPLLLSFMLVAVFYLPWIWTLLASVGRVAASTTYSLTGNIFLEQALRLLYWFVSFTFGESLPLWAIVAGALLSPVIVWLLWRYCRVSSSQPVLDRLLVLAVAITYAGAAMWVAFVFTPARALFLLPFYLLALVEAIAAPGLPRTIVRYSLLVIWVGSLGAYFHKEGFLNQGYLTPFAEMAAYIKSDSQPASTLIVVDGYNVDPKPLVSALCAEYHCIVVRSRAEQEAVRLAARSSPQRVVWYLRGTHDISPGQVHSSLEALFSGRHQMRRRLYLPYSRAQQWALRLFAGKDPPTHYYQMLEFPPAANASRE